MRGPIASVKALSVAKNPAELQPAGSLARDKKYAEKLKLAAELHDQGIDPTRWTAAQPADWATQQAFQKTGQKDDRHFAVAGRLYKTTPQVAASQAQGQAALESYLGALAKPIEEMVDVEQVQLTHPTGRPHDPSGDRPDAHALNLHYARAGIDPASAHNGDPLPMESQAKLQQATRTADGSEIPLGIPGIYRGYDDGYFYAANDGTRESPDVQALRRKLAAEKAQVQGDVSAIVANDNDPEIDEAVAQSYGAKATEKPAAQSAATPEMLAQQNAKVTDNLPHLFSAIEKFQKGQVLSNKENDLLVHVGDVFSAIDMPIDLKKVDVKLLKKAAGHAANQPPAASVDTNSSSPLIAGATLAIPAGGASFAGLRSAAATIGVLLEEAAVGTAVLGGAAFAALTGGFLAAMTKSTQPQEQEDADLRRMAELVAESRKPRQENSNPSPEAETSDINQYHPAESTVVQSAAANSAPTQIIQSFEAPADFKPDSKYMWDAQQDFAHALLQGQMPEIRIDGQLITVKNIHGSRGKPIVQLLDERASIAIKSALVECQGMDNPEHIAGADKKQMNFPDPDSPGNLNSTRPDITFSFKHGDYNCMYHINTADTKVDGSLNAREGRNAERLVKNIEKIVRDFAEAINKGPIRKDPIAVSGYSFDYMSKPKSDSEDEVNEIIEKFMDEVFSCTEIMRECERTVPERKNNTLE